MVVFVTGGSGSGKSKYAEHLATELRQEAVRDYQKNGLIVQPSLVYIATMASVDQESRQRICRHRAMRAGKGFETREQFTHLEELAVKNHEILLLECLSNLTANEMFSSSGRKEGVAETVQKGICHLAEQSLHLVIVGNDVYGDGMEYDESVRDYLQEMARVHQFLGAYSDQVVEVICGIPIEWRKS